MQYKKDYHPETLALHSGYEQQSPDYSVEVPLYLTNAYAFSSAAHAKNLFSLSEEGNIYTRLSNPTVDILEKRIAALDGGIGAVAFASGHAAIFNAILNLAQAGDEIVSSVRIYGGAINMLGVTLKRLGIHVHFVDPSDLNAWENAVNEKTKAFFFETIGNPNADLSNIASISAIAHKYGIPVIADSTFTTPALCCPLAMGADFVVHSATKFLSGHGAVMGGLVVDGGSFSFCDNPRFPLYNRPDESYHGLVYASLGNAAFLARLRSLIMRDVGACLSPFNALQILYGIETLSLRMERHSQNALCVAKFLQEQKEVDFVHYPLLPQSPDYALAQKILPKGAGGVLTFGLKGGKEAGVRFIDSLRLFIHCANVGDTKSLVIHPATTTHSQLSKEQLEQAGITEGTIRLSVGIEQIDDIVADLKTAIKQAVD